MQYTATKLYGRAKLHEAIPIALKKEDILYSFDLPPTLKLVPKSGKSQYYPWGQLGNFVIDKLGGISNCTNLSVSDLVVGPDTYNLLSRLSFNWVLKAMGSSYAKIPVAVEKTFAWHTLSDSPCMSDDSFIEEGKVYIRKKP